MTLEEWEIRHNEADLLPFNSGALLVVSVDKDLWNLEDYKVSSRISEAVILVKNPKNNKKEKS